MNINPRTDALIIIDPQNDFCPDGALAVNGGDGIMRGIDKLSDLFEMVVITQDWHPKGHKSFASTWYMDPFSSIDMPYGKQTLWPDHCVQGTKGAEFHPFLDKALTKAKLIVRKGYNPEVDSYSAFFENDGVTSTGLSGFLKDKGIERLFIVGLAYDFCVAFSALDGIKQGFDVFVVKDLTKAIAQPVEVEIPEGLTGVTQADYHFTTEIVQQAKMRSEGVREIESSLINLEPAEA